MIHRHIIVAVLFACISGLSGVQAQSLLSGNFSNVNLQPVLDSLASNFDINFSFDPEYIRTQNIQKLKGRDKDLKWWLSQIKARCEVDFVEISEGNFAIKRFKKPIAYWKGQVFDAVTGEGLPGAVVMVFSGSAKDPIDGAITDDAGRFMIKPAPANAQMITRYLGYAPDTIPVGDNRLPSNASTRTFTIRLRNAELKTPAIIVTGQSDLPVSRGTHDLALNPRRFDAISVLGEPDVFRTLQWLPGVSSTEESSNGLYIRGSTPDQNLVLLDDIPIYNTGHFFGMFHAFNADALDKIELHRNGFDAEFGGVVSSLIDITSKPRTADSLEVDLNLNLAATSASVTVPLAPKKAALLLAGRRSYNDILSSPLYQQISGNVFQTGSIFADEQASEAVPDEIFELDPVSNFHDLHAKLLVDVSPKDRATATFYNGFDGVRYYSALLDTSEGEQREAEETLRLSNVAAGLTWNRDWSPKVQTEHTAWYSTFRGRYFNEQTLSEDFDSLSYLSLQDNGINSASFKNTISIRLHEAHSIKAGLQYTGYSTGWSIETEENEERNVDQLTLEGNVASAFASYSFRPSTRFDFRPGIRFSYYDADEEPFLEPRLRVRYEVFKGVRLTADAGLYQQVLNPIVVNNSLKLGTEFLSLPSEDDGITGSQGKQASVGVSWLRPGVWLEVQAYWKEMEGLQRYTRSFDEVTNSNEVEDLLEDGFGEVMGLDMFVRGQIGNWSGWASYTLSQVNHTFDSLNNGLPFAADHDHLHELKLVNVFRYKRWEASVTWIFASGKPYSEPTSIATYTEPGGDNYYELFYPAINNRRLEPYHRLDLNLTYRFPLLRRGTARAGLAIFNLYDRDNIRDRNYSIDFPDNGQPPDEILTIDRNLLGLSPNVFFRLSF